MKYQSCRSRITSHLGKDQSLWRITLKSFLVATNYQIQQQEVQHNSKEVQQELILYKRKHTKQHLFEYHSKSLRLLSCCTMQCSKISRSVGIVKT